jgi:hypothetical protein
MWTSGLRVIALEKIRRALGLEVTDCLVNAREIPCHDDVIANGERSSDVDFDDNLCKFDQVGLPSASIGISCGSPEGVALSTISGCYICQCQIGIVSRDASAVSMLSCNFSACGDCAIVSRDASSIVLNKCRISTSGTGLVLQNVSSCLTDQLVFTKCGVGILVHRTCNGSLESIDIRGCERGLIFARGGSGLKTSKISVYGGRSGVVVGATCNLSGIEAENCEDEGFLVERSGRLVLKDCTAVKCGTGCCVHGDLTCHDCTWTRCGAGFLR